MKVKKIEVKNLQAISEKSANFDGCSAIISAGNNKGKSTFLRGLIDRFRGEKFVVREGEKSGFSIMELTDGSKIEWKFTEKSENFAFITKEGIKQTAGVIKSIGERYFGIKFDIDKFLHKSPREQAKDLARIVGLDFSDIDEEYKTAYEERKIANRQLKDIIAKKLTAPEPVEFIDITPFKEQLENIQKENEIKRREWKELNEKHVNEIQEFNREQDEIKNKHRIAIEAQGNLIRLGFSSNELDNFVKSFIPKVHKSITNLPDPEYINSDDIQKKLDEANENLRAYHVYKSQLKTYDNWVTEGKEARKNAEYWDAEAKRIQAEKLKMISNADIPKEFEFTEEGEIIYNGFPLSNNQISSSGKYIAALKLGLLSLGELRTMHFDASFLDKHSLQEIETWAKTNDLQLLIEKPEFDGGEMKFELIKD